MSKLNWERDGKYWPHRECSRFIEAGGLRWHVQQMGTGPLLLLVHGTGAATHSWRGLLPLLAENFTLLAPDLPGHGFTEAPPTDSLSLPGMAAYLGALLTQLDVQPAIAIGHSAGAAILAQLCLNGGVNPHALISLNGALLPLRGMPGHIFAPAAKLLSTLFFVPHLFAWHASSPQVTAQLIAGTGSNLDADGLDLYRQLLRSPGHVASALGMMAHWDLQPLVQALPQLRTPLHLVTCANDRTVPPEDAERVLHLLPTARWLSLPDLGHLGHEEQPQSIAEILFGIARRLNLVGTR